MWRGPVGERFKEKSKFIFCLFSLDVEKRNITRFELDRERFLDMLRRVEDDVQTEVEEAGG